jgi:hypothetical protein
MNEYGLDYKYFNKNLERIIRDSKCYTPNEMQRALTRLASVAENQREKRLNDLVEHFKDDQSSSTSHVR